MVPVFATTGFVREYFHKIHLLWFTITNCDPVCV